MDNFQEFEQPMGPQKSSGDIISHAFEMYKGVFLYALLAMVIYIVASIFIRALTGFDSMALSEEMRSSRGNFSGIDFWAIPNLGIYSGLSGLLGILITPLFVGIIYMANKYNFKQHLDVSDLFIGYRQNFVNILIYTVLFNIILGISFAMCVIPGFFVLPFFLLGYPILLFENASFSDALSKSFNIAKENYGVFLGASFLGLLISIAGIFLCGIGIIATMPFFIIVSYSTYCAYCGRPRPLHTPD
ncbi:beta-carotene 15,15'-monooxygenase [Kaistella sp. G5-32]|uniref:Beta-carotene 15,15'-monooxygenase n=1 Tax=Kaistella gelatinilytica TaxID=2787636 RepID=A0ABS0FDS3_9FLAO|nr:beta-carotene 15,15'-monooxygenase [Kaistella gelatinilytica]MBF8457854.1 beta-carotene 15,15'-monooxygenase [Kaistella gelatinilytica]